MWVGWGYGGVNVFRIARTVLTAGVASLALALASQAATINEGSFAGGDFSGTFGSPTAIGRGYDVIDGTLSAGDYDFFRFANLNPGAQTLTFTISGPTGVGFYISRGTIRTSTTPFTSRTSGTALGTFLLSPLFGTSQSFTLNLGSSFAGSLYVSLNLNLGPVMRYSVNVPGNVDIPGIPLPASALMLGGALAGLGGFASRRAKRGAA